MADFAGWLTPPAATTRKLGRLHSETKRLYSETGIQKLRRGIRKLIFGNYKKILRKLVFGNWMVASGNDCSETTFCWAVAAIHDQPSNNWFCEKTGKNKTKANENAKAAQFALFLHLFCSFVPGATCGPMRTFTRQQNLLAVRSREEKQKRMRKLSDKK